MKFIGVRRLERWESKRVGPTLKEDLGMKAALEGRLLQQRKKIRAASARKTGGHPGDFPWIGRGEKAKRKRRPS